MKRIPKSQKTKFSQHSAADDADKPHTSVGVRPTENAKEESSVDVDFDATVPGEVETDATGKNILIRDNDASDDTSELRLLDESSPDDSESNESGESDEFDPYNSGTFDMSKSRSRK
jgi:hypothetical protein